MQSNQLSTTLSDGRTRCEICQWQCVLAPGETGRCLVRHNVEGRIEPLHYGMIPAAQISAVEDLRLFHFFPGQTMLALGGYGYAFPGDQQRGQYATPPDDPQRRRVLDPERAAAFALDRLCRGVAYAYGDPSVSFEYVNDLLRTARASSRVTLLVTSGYMSMAALDEIGHYLDGLLLELRAFDDAAYSRLAGVDHWRGILDVAARARSRWGVHLEVSTRLHPGVNDQLEHLRQMAAWLRDALGPQTPWHLLPGDAGAAAAASVARGRRAGAEAGLQFVYGPEPGQPTHCPQCGLEAIERTADRRVHLPRVTDGRCSNCGTDLGLRTSIFKRS